MNPVYEIMLNNILTDIKMLQNGEWEPDFDSCQATLDNIEQLISQLIADGMVRENFEF
jgi:hypothetical protein